MTEDSEIQQVDGNAIYNWMETALRVLIVIDGSKDKKEVASFNRKFLELLAINDIPHNILPLLPSEMWSITKEDTVIFRRNLTDDHYLLAPILTQIWEREIGVRVFPDWSTSWHYDDKISQYLLCKAHDLPYTESWIFWNKQEALHWAETEARYPVVFKLKGGAGSSNVVLVRKRAEAIKLIKAMFGKGIRQWHVPSADNVWFHPSSFIKTIKWHLLNIMRSFRGEDPMEGYLPHKNYALFQKFLPGNAFDTRITVIGDRAFAFRRMNRKNDFRSSGSGKIDYDQNKIDKRCLEVAFKVSAELKFQSMAYDFLKNESGGIEFCEMSYSYNDTAIYNCPGHWDRAGNFIEGHFWPQTCILEELLHINIRQP